MAFLEVRKKVVSRQRLRGFWADKENRKSKEIAQPHDARVVVVSPSCLGRLRCFNSRKELAAYKKNVKIMESAVALSKPKTFELQATQFFGQRMQNGKVFLLERVYRSPTLYEMLYPEEKEHSIFWQTFLRKMEIKGINFKKNVPRLKEDAREMQKELNPIWQKLEQKGLRTDDNPTNVLVHDYEPKTGKFLITVIDPFLHPKFQ